jgi:hypothetical protein
MSGTTRRRAMALLACPIPFAVFAAPLYPALAQGRKTVLVSPVRTDPALAGRLPITYSADALRRELEVALETTGVFTVASRDHRDLDPVLDEIARAKRRPRGEFRMAELILNPVLEGFSINERRRPAPMMRNKDSVSVSGVIALTVEVMNVSDGSVQTRMQIDLAYQTPEHLADPMANDPLVYSSAHHGDASPEEIKASYQALGRVFAKRVLDQVYPAVVAQRSGDRIYISRGEDAGYRVGDVLRIIRRGAPIRHPVTQQIIGYDEQTVGEAKVIETLPRMTVAKITSSTAEAAAGDIVREPVADPPPRDDD